MLRFWEIRGLLAVADNAIQAQDLVMKATGETYPLEEFTQCKQRVPLFLLNDVRPAFEWLATDFKVPQYVGPEDPPPPDDS